MSFFTELSILLALTTVVTLVVKMLRQPLVVGYILSGILAGPYLLNVLHSSHELELFSKVGIVLLLFIVGLHLNPKVIKEVGTVSLITGVGQVLFTSVIGFGIALLLGIDKVAALYVGIALTFSSTIIVLKLLADKRDLQKLYAKISIGFLLVQDIIATFVLVAISIFSVGSQDGFFITFLWILFKGLGLLCILIAVQKFILPRLLNAVAASQELLFVFSLSWGMSLASLFVLFGFSIEIGALVAGVLLSVSPYADEIASRVKPLRDFFIVVFFILLGSQMVLTNFHAILIPALIFSLFVLIGNPVIVIILMNITGHSRRTGFLAGLTVAQISEFSLILASLGLQVGHLSQELMSLITLVGLITIAGSTYFILYAEKIYPKINKALSALELIKKGKKKSGANGDDFESIIFGYDRVGVEFVRAIKKQDLSYLIVDFNPKSIQKIIDSNFPFRFGDASDVEFLEELPTLKPKLVISTIPDRITNELIIRSMKARSSKVVLIVVAHDKKEAIALYSLGATLVVIPNQLGADYITKVIKNFGVASDAYIAESTKHVELLTMSVTS